MGAAVNLKGVQGLPGPQGIPGPQGEPGEDGKDGNANVMVYIYNRDFRTIASHSFLILGGAAAFPENHVWLVYLMVGGWETYMIPGKVPISANVSSNYEVDIDRVNDHRVGTQITVRRVLGTGGVHDVRIVKIPITSQIYGLADQYPGVDFNNYKSVSEHFNLKDSELVNFE